MLLDRETLDLLPRAAAVVESAGDPRFKLELPAAQLELQAAAGAHRARGDRRARGRTARPAGRGGAGRPRWRAAGVHPFAAPVGSSTRASATSRSSANTARSRGASSCARCRSMSPSAAPTARSPSTTGCARGCRSSPRSPPTRRSTPAAIPAWRRSGRRSPSSCRARGCRPRSRRGRRSPTRSRWGAASGAVPEPRRWWWELRPHPAFGTLEVRVPDAQATVAGRRRGGRARPRARRLAGRAPRCRRAARGRRHLAAGGEPLVGRALGHGRRARRPAHRRAHAGARVHRRAACRAAPRRRPARLRRRAERRRAARVAKTAPCASAPSRRRAACGRSSRGWRTPIRRRDYASAAAGTTSRNETRRTASGRWRAGERDPRACRSHTAARAARPHDRAAAGRPAAGPAQAAPIPLPEGADPLADEDLQLALYLCYELHYRGLPGVDDRWEWSPSLLALRQALEEPFERALRDAVGTVGPAPPPEEFDLALRAIADADDAPSLSRHIERAATLEQVLEFVVHRSAYQLKEADPHSWAIAAPQRAAEGGAGRDPGRRVRRRAARAGARAAVRRRDGGARPRRPLRRVPRPAAGGDAGDRQPDVAVRAAPAAARRDRRPPRAVRDDLVDPQPPLRGRPAPAGVDDPAATEFFDEHVDGRRGARGGRRGRPRRRARAAASPSSRTTSSGAPPRWLPSRRAGRGSLLGAWERGELVAAAAAVDAERRPSSRSSCAPASARSAP